jgi:transcriptional regulator with XRE-family HTH domain
MAVKVKEKEIAIELRRQGYSYSEILKRVPVAKSTLSLWLRSVGLAKQQKQRLTEKRLAALKRGWEACRRKRILIMSKIKEDAKKEIKEITQRDLRLIGIVLYWAEGAKEKEYRRGELVSFSNSDPNIILLFIKWLKEICLVSPSNLIYELYIHETANWRKTQKYWAKILSIPINQIRVYFKKHKINSKRKNIGKNYHGLMRIKVKRSINLNRKISGWIEKICELLQCGVV